MESLYDLSENPFLNESFTFGMLLMKVAIPDLVSGTPCDQIRQKFAEITANYEDTALRRCIMRMCPPFGIIDRHLLVTVDWIMRQYEMAHE